MSKAIPDKMTQAIPCHHCGKAMQPDARASEQERYRCNSCGATRVSCRVEVEGETFSVDPFDNYVSSQQYEAEADDAARFRLRMSEPKH